MPNENIPTGKLFTHVYLDRSKPLKDSPNFRKRIGYCFQSLFDDNRERNAANFFKLEMGLDIPWHGTFYNFEEFFERIEIHYLLNAITLAWRYFNGTQARETTVKWRDFVKRALKEENLGYYLDKECGVHYLVDSEFEHNRVSALRCLEDSKYAGVRKAFEHAFKEIDSTPPHTKDAVRAIFESIEILVKQMVQTNNLHNKVIKKELKEKALERYKDDPTAQDSVDKMFAGFAEWVDAIHNYRHGQGASEPVEPPLELAVYALSSGAAFLRWLVAIDSAP